MDRKKAQNLEIELKNKEFLEYKVIELLNNGKSAAVFKVEDQKGMPFALKIFDNELIEKFGHEIQEHRIKEEIKLKGHNISNLVKIINGGTADFLGNKFYYIIMEFVNGKNISEFIKTEIYDNAYLRRIVSVIFNTSEQLLHMGIAHRDIKPDNIMITNEREVILMDLGVLKLIGSPSLSDNDEKQFVGTLRYAPPEFLTRHEEDSVDGWRAVNLYQLGGVLHDLIMQKELFAKSVPFSNLVLSIKEDAPFISNTSYPFSTIQLARDLLIKDWKNRLTICSVERVKSFIATNPSSLSSIDQEIEDLKQLASGHKIKFDEIEKISRTRAEKEKKIKSILTAIQDHLYSCLSTIRDKGVFDEIVVGKAFQMNSDLVSLGWTEGKNLFFRLSGSLTKGFPRPLHFLAMFTSDENSLASISVLPMFLRDGVEDESSFPTAILTNVSREKTREFPPFNERLHQEKLTPMFHGTVGFDEQFREKIIYELIQLLKKSLTEISKEVDTLLKVQEQMAKGNRSPSFSVSHTVIIWKKIYP